MWSRRFCCGLLVVIIPFQLFWLVKIPSSLSGGPLEIATGGLQGEAIPDEDEGLNLPPALMNRTLQKLKVLRKTVKSSTAESENRTTLSEVYCREISGSHVLLLRNVMISPWRGFGLITAAFNSHGNHTLFEELVQKMTDCVMSTDVFGLLPYMNSRAGIQSTVMTRKQAKQCPHFRNHYAKQLNLKVVYNRYLGFHTYHGIIGPTGASQVYLTTRHFMNFVDEEQPGSFVNRTDDPAETRIGNTSKVVFLLSGNVAPKTVHPFAQGVSDAVFGQRKFRTLKKPFCDQWVTIELGGKYAVVDARNSQMVPKRRTARLVRQMRDEAVRVIEEGLIGGRSKISEVGNDVSSASSARVSGVTESTQTSTDQERAKSEWMMTNISSTVNGSSTVATDSVMVDEEEGIDIQQRKDDQSAGSPTSSAMLPSSQYNILYVKRPRMAIKSGRLRGIDDNVAVELLLRLYSYVSGGGSGESGSVTKESGMETSGRSSTTAIPASSFLVKERIHASVVNYIREFLPSLTRESMVSGSAVPQLNKSNFEVNENKQKDHDADVAESTRDRMRGGARVREDVVATVTTARFEELDFEVQYTHVRSSHHVLMAEGAALVSMMFSPVNTTFVCVYDVTVDMKILERRKRKQDRFRKQVFDRWKEMNISGPTTEEETMYFQDPYFHISWAYIFGIRLIFFEVCDGKYPASYDKLEAFLRSSFLGKGGRFVPGVFTVLCEAPTGTVVPATRKRNARDARTAGSDQGSQGNTTAKGDGEEEMDVSALPPLKRKPYHVAGMERILPPP